MNKYYFTFESEEYANYYGITQFVIAKNKKEAIKKIKEIYNTIEIPEIYDQYAI